MMSARKERYTKMDRLTVVKGTEVAIRLATPGRTFVTAAATAAHSLGAPNPSDKGSDTRDTADCGLHTHVGYLASPEM
jgi:hypothetical protein